MNDENGLDNDDHFIISELVMWKDEPLTAKDIKGISNPSAHLKKMEKLGYIQQSDWDYKGKYYKPNIRNLLKAGIIEKGKHGYNINMGTFKHRFTLGLDSPTEEGLMSLFKGLDRVKEINWETWKTSIQIVVKALNHMFVETDKGFLTEEQSIAKKKRLTEEARKEYEEFEK